MSLDFDYSKYLFNYQTMPTMQNIAGCLINNNINYSLPNNILDNGLGFNFMMPTPDYSQLLQNAIKLNEQYMAMMTEKNKMMMQMIQANSAMKSDQLGTPIDTSLSIDDTKNISYDAQELKAKWAAKKPNLSDKFYEKVVKIAKKVKCNPNSLMAVMYAESGIVQTAKNPNPNCTATGLIQFTKVTAKELGTTITKLQKMTAEEQLDYVEKHLLKWKKANGIASSEFLDIGTLYALVFLPGRANKEYLTNKTEKFYSAGENEKLDLNKDGYISKTELAQRAQNYIA